MSLCARGWREPSHQGHVPDKKPRHVAGLLVRNRGHCPNVPRDPTYTSALHRRSLSFVPSRQRSSLRRSAESLSKPFAQTGSSPMVLRTSMGNSTTSFARVPVFTNSHVTLRDGSEGREIRRFQQQFAHTASSSMPIGYWQLGQIRWSMTSSPCPTATRSSKTKHAPFHLLSDSGMLLR